MTGRSYKGAGNFLCLVLGASYIRVPLFVKIHSATYLYMEFLMYIIILYKSFEKLTRKYIPIS